MKIGIRAPTLFHPMIVIGVLLTPAVSFGADNPLTAYMVGHRIDMTIQWRRKAPLDQIEDAKLLAVDPVGLIFEAPSTVFSRRGRLEHFYVRWDQVVALNCRNCPSPDLAGE